MLGPDSVEQKLAHFRRVLIVQLVFLAVIMVLLAMAPEAAGGAAKPAIDPAQPVDQAKHLAQWLQHHREHRELRTGLLAPLVWLLATLLPAVPLLRALQSFVLAHRLDLDTRHRIAAASADPQR